ncbi:MAG: hypothetical protein M1837_001159 [Sclerophora amabilis]|nr:MAG: hypothetical protein M1837_001159 [Sclerophora amabilis]
MPCNDIAGTSISYGNGHLNGTKKGAPKATNGSGNIVDIRRDSIEHSIKDEIFEKLRPGPGKEKRLPTLLLYDEIGLKLFEKLTYLDEYYLTNAEIDVLERYAGSIAERIAPGSLLVELGSGNLRKVNILLQAFERIGKAIDYYALDLSLPELHRTLAELPTADLKSVKCFGLHGTYDDGLEWLQRPELLSRPKCILSLGSSLGNFTRPDAASFLAGFRRTLQPGDCMLFGLDGCKDKDKVFRAYNDREGVTHEFYRNGLRYANQVLEESLFNIDDWRIIGEYDEEAGRHQAFYAPKKDVHIGDVILQAGERVRIEESYKYSKPETDRLWRLAGLMEDDVWPPNDCDYHLHMLAPSTFACSPHPEMYARSPVPSLADWNGLWVVWDTITRGMIPKEELLSKPIKLRNACIFYLGHIPTFLDMHLTRALGGKPTDPEHYPTIFERGIDPDVDDPEQCHNHSEIPESWPPAEEITTFQDRVRSRVAEQYQNKATETNHEVRRALWLAFEHEVMHLETFLYMLLQSDKKLPPPGQAKPDFAALAEQARIKAVPNDWITVPASDIEIGLNDLDNDNGSARYFGWDNEKPCRQVAVPSFEAQARPITNGEYAYYLKRSGKQTWPASWAVDGGKNGLKMTNGETNGYTNGHADGSTLESRQIEENSEYLQGKSVKTVFGLVPLNQALDWPIMASYDELVGYAKWANGRIPTFEEVRSIYHFADGLKTKEADKVLAKTIAAVNGHLSNDGVEESPPSRALSNGASSAEERPNPNQLFANLEGCNVGFKNWHPVPVTANGNRLSGQGEVGGVWEWTSSVLEEHDGFEPMDLYPGYTADFFDGKHNIVLGGSWATHPRIAGRKTFVNWYQRNYPYAWAGARLVRDL